MYDRFAGPEKDGRITEEAVRRGSTVRPTETQPVCNEGVVFGRAKVAFLCS